LTTDETTSNSASLTGEGEVGSTPLGAISEGPKLRLSKLWEAKGLLRPYTEKLKITLDTQHCAVLHCTAMDEQEYERIKKEINSRHAKELEALETIWNIERGKQPPMDILGSVTWADMVRKVLPGLSEPFGKFEIEKAVIEQFRGAKDKLRKNSLSGILTRMQQHHEIELVEAGSGPRPSTYRRKRT
jgi:hypothetical protein